MPIGDDERDPEADRSGVPAEQVAGGTGPVETAGGLGPSPVVVDYLSGGPFADASVRAVDQQGREVALNSGDVVDARVAGLYITDFLTPTVPFEQRERVVTRALNAIRGLVKRGVTKLVLQASEGVPVVVEL